MVDGPQLEEGSGSAPQSVTPAVSQLFSVGGRPLSVKFTGLNTLNPASQPFTAEVSVWDEALDTAAASGVAPTAVTCTVALVGGDGAQLEGTTEVTTASKFRVNAT